MSEFNFRSHFWPFQIDTQLFFWNFWQNGWRLPFWMSLSTFHFRSHFWPIQIDTQLFFFWKFWQNPCCRPFWMSENHFRSHFYPFHIDTQLKFFWNFWQWLTSANLDVMSEFHFRSHSWPFQIDTQLYFLWNFWQNGWRRLFWMSKIHFRSHFWPFQIDMQLYFFLKFLTKSLLSAILDVRNSLWITFLTILDQYRFFFDFFFYKMADVGHFGCPNFTFDRIPGHFRSIRNFNNFLWNFWQNGWRRLF